MPGPLSDRDFVELEQLTGIDASQWQDLQKLEAKDARALVDGWRELGALSWTVQESVMSRVLVILNGAAAIANPVSAVAGGVTGIGAAISALRGL